MLRARFEGAVNAKAYKLASVVLGAMANLAAAVGAASFAADAEAVVQPLVALLVQHRALLVETALLEPLHASLAKMAAPMGAAFQPHFEQVLPLLLEAAAVEPEVHTDEVEEEGENEGDDTGFDTTYADNGGRGYLRIRVNTAQMDDKVLAATAIWQCAPPSPPRSPVTLPSARGADGSPRVIAVRAAVP